jgi:hypothetical protein
MAHPDRPTPVLVIAIFHFIIGGISLLWSLCVGGLIFVMAALFSAAIGEMRKKDPAEAQLLQDFMDSLVGIPGMVPYFISNLAITLIFGVLLIVAGFGLLKMRNWARTLSIVYGVAGLLLVIGDGVYSMAVLTPAVEKANEDFQRKVEQHVKARGRPMPQQNNPFANNPLINIGSGVLGMIWNAVYKVAVLIVMFLPSVSAAFARARRGQTLYEPAAEKEEDEFGFDRRGYGGDQGY